MKIYVALICAACIAACSSQPSAPSKPVVPESSGAAAAAAAPKAQVATAPAADAAAADGVNQAYLKRGYKAVNQNGTLLYCRTELVTGSNFKTTTCLTSDQMKSLDQQLQNSKDQLRSPGQGANVGPKGN